MKIKSYRYVSSSTSTGLRYGRYAEVFQIQYILSNVTITGTKPNNVVKGSSLQYYVKSNSGYTLPSSISVTGGTVSSWSTSTGTLIINDIIDDLKIQIIGESTAPVVGGNYAFTRYLPYTDGNISLPDMEITCNDRSYTGFYIQGGNIYFGSYEACMGGVWDESLGETFSLTLNGSIDSALSNWLSLNGRKGSFDRYLNGRYTFIDNPSKIADGVYRLYLPNVTTNGYYYTNDSQATHPDLLKGVLNIIEIYGDGPIVNIGYINNYTQDIGEADRIEYNGSNDTADRWKSYISGSEVAPKMFTNGLRTIEFNMLQEAPDAFYDWIQENTIRVDEDLVRVTTVNEVTYYSTYQWADSANIGNYFAGLPDSSASTILEQGFNYGENLPFDAEGETATIITSEGNISYGEDGNELVYSVSDGWVSEGYRKIQFTSLEEVQKIPVNNGDTAFAALSQGLLKRQYNIIKWPIFDANSSQHITVEIDGNIIPSESETTEMVKRNYETCGLFVGEDDIQHIIRIYSDGEEDANFVVLSNGYKLSESDSIYRQDIEVVSDINGIKSLQVVYNYASEQ